MTLAISCTGQKSNKENIVATNTFLIGKWTGEGRFMDLAFNINFGTVMFEIEINNDNTISGRVGEARLVKTKIAETHDGFKIKGILDSKIKKDKWCRLEYLYLLHF